MDCRFVTTTDWYRACGYQMLLDAMDDPLRGTLPLKYAPLNQEKAYGKGWNPSDFAHSPKRLSPPWNRHAGRSARLHVFRPKAAKSEHGRDSIFFLGSMSDRGRLPSTFLWLYKH